MKTGPNLEQRADPSANFGSALRRWRDARQNLQECALPGTILANDPKDLPAPHLEGHVAECPEEVGLVGPQERWEEFLQALAPARCAREVLLMLLWYKKLFPQPVNADRYIIIAH